jgi:DNA-binding MarR family transcriptional regulator
MAHTEKDLDVVAAFLQSAHFHLTRALRLAEKELDVGGAECGSALVLLFARGALSVEELAAAERAPAPAIGDCVATLCKQGLAEPRTDGRWEVTDAGRELVERGRAARIVNLARGLKGLSDDDIEVVSRSVEALERLARSISSS